MSTDPKQTDLQRDPKTKIKLDILTTYIDGKMKRYNLLFAVNGGAFILAKLIYETENGRIGHLTLTDLAIGAILFTAVMTLDMWLWGRSLRKQYCEYVDEQKWKQYCEHVDTQEGEAIPLWDRLFNDLWDRLFNDKNSVFTLAGKGILLVLFVLLECAWILAIW